MESGMSRLRCEQGAYSFAGIMAALLVVAVLGAGAMAMYGSLGAGGGGVGDKVAMSEVQHAYTALQRCQRQGAVDGCNPKQLGEFEPTLIPYINHMTVSGSSVSIEAKSGNVFTITAASPGRVTRTCTNPGTGACPKNGYW
jgi:hypothetical protein